ncbi:amidase [Thermodesulfobacteriota bacterium]
MSNSEICFMTATHMAECIRSKELSVLEVMEAHLSRIEEVNPKVNAIVTLLPEEALDKARAADEALARGEATGPLFGLPIAHKDLALTKGIRTTMGSPIFRDFVPDQDQLVVERIKQAGAITIGKTNTPEFGAGSQTYNEVFGETLNPYDLTKTCGGSSGGAAVSLACGMLPIADGSDMGGSLRNPASFCNIVGLRPSPGRVPYWPGELGWFTLMVEGPMARTVEDAAQLLSAQAGPDPRSPTSIAEPGSIFAGPLDRDFTNTRIAWSRDLGGLPVDPRVTTVIENGIGTFEDIGCRVEQTELDFDGADETFKAWRAFYMELRVDPLLEKNRHQIKETVLWNAEQGLKLTGPELARIEAKRTQLYHRVREFMAEYEFMIMPVSQVPPFDVKQRWITEIDGVKMETYIDWMKSCYYISTFGHPALSVPCGFTPEGLPVGVQIVGRHNDDLGVLQLGYAFQQATELWKNRPAI